MAEEKMSKFWLILPLIRTCYCQRVNNHIILSKSTQCSSWMLVHNSLYCRDFQKGMQREVRNCEQMGKVMSRGRGSLLSLTPSPLLPNVLPNPGSLFGSLTLSIAWFISLPVRKQLLHRLGTQLYKL